MGRRRYYRRRRYRRRQAGLLEIAIDDALSPGRPKRRRSKKSSDKESPLFPFIAALVFLAGVTSASYSNNTLQFEFAEFFGKLFLILIAILGVYFFISEFTNLLHFIKEKISKAFRPSVDNHPERPAQNFAETMPPQPKYEKASREIPVEPTPVARKEAVPIEPAPATNTNAEVYNQIGSLTELLGKLHERGIFEFKTLSDIKAFRREYKSKLGEIRKKNEELLKQTIANFEEQLTALKSDLDKKREERKAELTKEQTDLENTLAEPENPKNWFEQILFFFKKKNVLKRKSILDTAFETELERPLRDLIQEIKSLEEQITERKNNTEKWVESFSSEEVEKLERALSVFVENKSLFYGALGEEKVQHELAKLPPEYTVINDYRLSFATPIYRKAEDDRIWSIQLDHIVVGPTGIFLIETKNWSKQSIKNLDLYSPVEQLKRHNFALFTILNGAAGSGTLRSFNTHWGTKKISPKNVILLINNKPQETYQYVKILSLGEIRNYIQNEKQIFSTDEVNDLVRYLTEPEKSWF